MLIVKPGMTDASDLEPTDEQLPGIDAEEIEPRFRAVMGRGGERRGIRLERIYWDGLSRMSTSGKMSTADLVHYTAAQMPESGNLASLLRVLSLKWALRRLDTVEDISSLANVNAIIQASLKSCTFFSIDTQIEEAIATLTRNKGKTLNTGFTIAVGTQTMKGQINLALAPTHEKSMLIGYISRY
jgi:predicted DNA-binding ribbon-helix-helix protein